MATVVVGYTLVYALFSLCIIFPPTEFIAAGLTVQCLFAHYLGSEDIQFMQYHIRRTALTLFVHSLIPVGYVFGLCKLQSKDNESVLTVAANDATLTLLITVTVLLPFSILILINYWRQDNWRNHPIAQTLKLYGSSNGQNWNDVANSVNVEFRRVDKFATAANSYTRIIVTDSWMIKVMQYGMKIVHQSDVQLNVIGSDEHSISHISSTGIQFINIMVTSVRTAIAPFTIRLNSLEYNDLREKLQKPIQNASNILVHQTLSDLFLEAFKTQVLSNQRYLLNENILDMESCIGCMQMPANIKLQKLCSDNSIPGGECVQCYCRPMWCIECMGKWFASRQDQERPDTWLGSGSPCPTCRARFCMLDVCLLESSS